MNKNYYEHQKDYVKPNPILNQHKWEQPNSLSYEICVRCNVVRRSDDKNSPCKGSYKLRVGNVNE